MTKDVRSMIPQGHQLYKAGDDMFTYFSATNAREAYGFFCHFLSDREHLSVTDEAVFPMAKVFFWENGASFCITEVDGEWEYTHQNVIIPDYENIDSSLLSNDLSVELRFENFSLGPNKLPEIFVGLKIAISKQINIGFFGRKHRIHLETPEDYMKVKLSL